MPELPEVETIRRQLEQELVGERIVVVNVRTRSIIHGDEKDLIQQTIDRVARVGKYLLIHFRSGKGAIIHLKMTGRLIIGRIQDTDDRSTPLAELDYAHAAHTRLVIALSSGRPLYYWDIRKFGYWRPVDDSTAAQALLVRTLGPDPWSLDGDALYHKLQRTRRSLKDTLLDQKVVAGVGNIYANDALWLARLDPRKPASTVARDESTVLLACLQSVLTKGLATGGASDNTYRDLYGSKGAYQTNFLVYGRTRQPCLTCSTPLTYIHLGGRGTWLCESCQQ